MLTRRRVLGGAVIALAQTATRIVVSPRPAPTLICGDVITPCVVGRTGIREGKHEGDGATPAGQYPLRRLMFRPDRVSPVATHLPISTIGTADAWSDDPADPHYNQPVTLPYRWHHEDLWRTDNLYDIIMVIGYNDSPAIPGKGSAIFLHLSHPGLSGTDGCVAIPAASMIRLAALCDTATVIDIRS